MRLKLTQPQADFVFSKARHPAMVAGYGAGKSEAAVIRIALLALKYPGLSFGFVEPTFDLVRLIAWPRFQSKLEDWGIGSELNKAESVLRMENGSQVIFRSADNPERMVGFEIADGLIDEADTLRPDQAQAVWIKMLGRIRQKKPDGAINTLGAVSTPEGYGWMYHTFGKEPKPGYELIRAPTCSNPYLPEGYVEQLRATYSSQHLEAYLSGRFVNLSTGAVYYAFDRKQSHTDEVAKEGEALHIGVDFNVMNCAAIVCVVRGQDFYAVDEITGAFDTPALITAIKDRFPGRSILVYPDASGKNRKSQDATAGDIALLRQARFTVLHHAANPAIKDRVLSVNVMLGGEGKPRRLKVNTQKCPVLAQALEQQAYDKAGMPDKSSGVDHPLDALGYAVHYRYPVATTQASRVRVVGL